jgi:hypothetical protein
MRHLVVVAVVVAVVVGRGRGASREQPVRVC